MGEVVYSGKHIERAAHQATDMRTTITAPTKVRQRDRICTITLLSADLGAFVIAAFLAFAIDIAQQTSPYKRAIANLTTLGADWHGWGTLLVLVCLLGYFGG